MSQVKAYFDGEKIILPPGFAYSRPVSVLVDFPDGAPEPAPSAFWWRDFVGRTLRPRTAEEIDAELRELRDEQDDHEPRDR